MSSLRNGNLCALASHKHARSSCEHAKRHLQKMQARADIRRTLSVACDMPAGMGKPLRADSILQM